MSKLKLASTLITDRGKFRDEVYEGNPKGEECEIISNCLEHGGNVMDRIYRGNREVEVKPDTFLPYEIMAIIRDNLRKFENYPQLTEIKSRIKLKWE